MNRPASVFGLLCLLIAPVLIAQPADPPSSGAGASGAEDSAAQSVVNQLQQLVESEQPTGFALLEAILALPPDGLANANLPPGGGSPQRRADVAAAVGTALDSRGDLTSAARWYLASFNAHPVPSRVPALLRAGELEFSVGELEAATLRVRLVQSLADGADLQQRALILEGRILAARGERNSALARMEDAASLGGTYGALAESEANRIRGDAPLAAGTLPSPASLFGNVESWPERGPQLERETARTADPIPSAPDPGDPVDEPTPGTRASAIQTGSFRVEENAGYMARDLEDLGFDAVIRRSGSGDSAVYQVLVPIPADADPDRFRLQLREFGLEGFFVRD